jgi:hypothetical protein
MIPMATPPPRGPRPYIPGERQAPPPPPGPISEAAADIKRIRRAVVFIAWALGFLMAASLVFAIIIAVGIHQTANDLNNSINGTNNGVGICQSLGGSEPGC